jgi:GT2 family glycosyltransferase
MAQAGQPGTSPDADHWVTIVTVTFNSAPIVAGMLESVPSGVPVILVDNASRDVPALTGLATAAGASMVLNRENVGFGAACNQGASKATTPYVLFLNPDARLEPGALDLLKHATEHYPTATAMNPRIRESDGSPFFMRKSYLLPRADWMPRGWPEADRQVSVLSGAAMLVRRDAFEAVGGFDEKLFLYHEDDDLSIRLAASQGPLMFIRDAVVAHGSGASTGSPAAIAAFKAWHMGRSRVYGARKHGRPFAATRAILHALSQLASPVLLWSSRKRAKQVAYLRGCISGCAAGPGFEQRARRPSGIGTVP